MYPPKDEESVFPSSSLSAADDIPRRKHKHGDKPPIEGALPHLDNYLDSLISQCQEENTDDVNTDPSCEPPHKKKKRKKKKRETVEETQPYPDFSISELLTNCNVSFIQKDTSREPSGEENVDVLKTESHPEDDSLDNVMKGSFFEKKHSKNENLHEIHAKNKRKKCYNGEMPDLSQKKKKKALELIEHSDIENTSTEKKKKKKTREAFDVNEEIIYEENSVNLSTDTQRSLQPNEIGNFLDKTHPKSSRKLHKKKKHKGDIEEDSSFHKTPPGTERKIETEGEEKHQTLEESEEYEKTPDKKKKKKKKLQEEQVTTWSDLNLEMDYLNSISSTHEETTDATQNVIKKKKKKKHQKHPAEDTSATDDTLESIERKKKKKSKALDINSENESDLPEGETQHSSPEGNKDLLEMLSRKQDEMKSNKKHEANRKLYKAIKKQLLQEEKQRIGISAKKPNSRLASLDLQDVDVDQVKEASLFYKTIDDEQTQLLRNLNITIPFEVPPLHMIETRISAMPKQQQREDMAALGVPIKNRMFLKVEDDTIKQNWRNFCELHDIPLDPRPFFYLHGVGKTLPVKQRLKFVRFLAKGLNDRPLYKVYQRFKKLMGDLNKGKFSPEEDKLIVEYVGKSLTTRPFGELAPILNRDSQSIERRFKLLTSEAPKMVRNDENFNKMLKAIMKVTKCTDRKELEHRQITLKEWNKIGKKLGNIAGVVIRRIYLYRLYPALFVSRNVRNDVIKRQVVHILLQNHKDDWKDVDWKSIAKGYPGFTADRLMGLIHDLVKGHVPKEKRANLGEALIYLRDEVLGKQGNIIKSRIRSISLSDLYS